MLINWIKNIIRALHDPQDILQSSIRVPNTVYIVAGGPNGRAHYHRIPKDGYVIAVNQSVLIPDIHPDMWILNSMNRHVWRWIGKAHRAFHGVRVFKQNCVKTTLWHIPWHIRKRAYFVYIPNQAGQRQNPDRIPPNTLRGGGTVSGFAIQIAAHLGAKNIILCGADFSGQSYWNGRTGHHKKHGDIWAHTDAANAIIRDLKNEDELNIASLSPTKLNVPVC